MTKIILGFIVALISISGFSASSLINGAGATFPEPIYTKWFSEFKKADSQVSINYQALGSGGGIKQLIAGTVDFAATDIPMTTEESKSLKQPVLHIPTVLGAVVVSYNLKLDKPLKLTGEVIADLFSGQIKNWSDEKIKKLNPGVKLPDLAIVVATRADSSGTTAVFTDYLSKASASWKGKAGKTVDWFKGSIAAKGNAGVAGLIKQGEGAVGYIELVFALQNKMSFAHIQNKSGEYIEASNKSVSLAASGKVASEMIKNDFKMSITQSEIKGAYPISSFTWLLIPETLPKEKGTKIVNMLNWSLGEKGQAIAEQMNFSPLPKALRDAVLSKIKSIKLN
jgi:phosphate transport system substrate-binding protein